MFEFPAELFICLHSPGHRIISFPMWISRSLCNWQSADSFNPYLISIRSSSWGHLWFTPVHKSPSYITGRHVQHAPIHSGF